MWEIYKESIALYNLPLTAFLALCLVYWMLVSVGALRIRGLHVHAHTGHGGGHGGFHGAHAHGPAHAPTAAHAAAHAAGHAVAHGHASHHAAHGARGGTRTNPFLFFLRFMNVESVPLMVVLSFLFLFMWMIALPANYYLNPGVTGDRSFAIALGLAVPNFFASSVLTRFTTFPFKKIMRSLTIDEEREIPLVGRTGMVKTSQLTHDFGRIEVPTNGAPLLLQARVSDGSLPRGKEVVIYEHDADTGIAWVKPL